MVKVDVEIEWDRPYKKNEKSPCYIDVNSFVRAAKAILFFDKHLGKDLFEVKEIEFLNQLFGQQDNLSELHAQYFEKQPSPPN